MKTLIIAAALLATGGTALAQTTNTRTIDNPQVSGTRTTTTDGAGTLARDTELTRKSDGATATGSFDRSRTDTGVTVSGSQTGFGGQTRSADYARTRTADGYTATGTATGRGGETYNYNAAGTRTADGYSRNRAVTNSAGETLASRSASATRGADGSITRDRSSTRAQGFNRPQRAIRARGRR